MQMVNNLVENNIYADLKKTAERLVNIEWALKEEEW